MRKLRRWLGIGVLGLGLPGLAVAQDRDNEIDFDDADYQQTRIGEAEDAGGLRVGLRGGVGGYTGDLGEVTGTGALWGVQVSQDNWGRLGAEVGYEGTSIPLDVPGANGSVVQHGAVALGKVSPFSTGLGPVEDIKPFVGAGLGASFINVTDPAEQAFNNDTLLQVPVVAGVEFNPFGGITAGVRGTYRVLLGEDFTEPVQGENGQGGQLTTSLTLGGSF